MNKLAKKVLIIGSKGMLGQSLTDVFKKNDAFDVLEWDKNELDITNENAVLNKIEKIKPSVIINAAAYNDVDEFEKSEKAYEIAKKINGEALGYLAKAAKNVGAILVHYSTDYVFNGEPEIPEPNGCSHSCGSCTLHENSNLQIGFDEDAKPQPISKYGKTKLMGEKEIAKNTKEYYLIRTSKLFGCSGKSTVCKKSFFDSMLEAAKNKKKVKVVDEETSCFSYAPDVAQKTREIVETLRPFGIYHVVNGDPCTWYEAALELYHQAGIKTQVIPVEASEFPRPAKRPFYSVLINTKLNPLRSYKEALKDYLKKRKNAKD